MDYQQVAADLRQAYGQESAADRDKGEKFESFKAIPLGGPGDRFQALVLRKS